jgi:hypothetical protein
VLLLVLAVDLGDCFHSARTVVVPVVLVVLVVVEPEVAVSAAGEVLMVVVSLEVPAVIVIALWKVSVMCFQLFVMV